MYKYSSFDIIRIIRTKYNITQKELSYGIIDISYLSHLESGRKNGNQEILELLINRLNQISLKNKYNYKLRKELLLLTQEKYIDKLFEKQIHILEKYPENIDKIESLYNKFFLYFSNYQNCSFIHKLILFFYDNQNFNKCHYYSKKFYLQSYNEKKYYFQLEEVLMVDSISMLKNGKFDDIHNVESLIAINVGKFDEEIFEKILINVMNIFISVKNYEKSMFYCEFYSKYIKKPKYLLEKEIEYAISLKGLKNYDKSLKIYKKIIKMSTDIDIKLLCNNNIIYLLEDMKEKEKIKYRYNISKKIIENNEIKIKRLKQTYYTLGYTAYNINKKKDSKKFFYLFLITETNDFLEEYSIDKYNQTISFLFSLIDKKDIVIIKAIYKKIIEINQTNSSVELVAKFIEFLVKNNHYDIMNDFLVELKK